MQIETFKDTILGKLKSKVSPLFQKAQILFNSIDSNLTPQQKASEKTAFFAALVHFLKNNLDQNNNENIDAQLLLLNWLIPYVQPAIVRQLIPQLIGLLANLVKIDAPLALGVTGQLLNLSNKEDLPTPKFMQLYHLILEQSISDKKPARKQATKILQSFFQQRTLDLTPIHYDGLKSHLITNIAENNESSQFAITLLSQLQNTIPYSLLIDALYAIIQQLNNMDPKYYTYCFLSLESILQHTIGSDQVEKLLQILLTIQPEEINAKHAYIQCLRQTLLAYQQASNQGAQYLPSVISSIIEYLLQDNLKLQVHAKEEIIRLIQQVGTKALSKQNDLVQDIMALELESSTTFQKKYLAILSYLLSNRFDHVNILDIFASFFHTLTEATFPKEFVQEFVQQKNRWPHVQFEKTFGALAQSVPIRLLLQLYPIKLENVDPLSIDFDEKTNSWILYILSRYSKPTFEDYLDYLYPLLPMIQHVNGEQTSEQKLILNIVIHLITIASNCQITQLRQNYNIKIIGFLELIHQNLSQDKPFYNQLLMMIAKLYSQMVSNKQSQQYLSEKAQGYISTLAKIVQSCPFNDLTLNAIKVIAFAAPQTYLVKAFRKNVDKIMESKDNVDQTVLKNMDIVLQIVCALELNSDLWSYCIQFCRSTIGVASLQKKIYKFLVETMKKVHYTFLEEAYTLLLECECAPSSRQKRFLAILTLMESEFMSESKRFQLEDFQTFIQNFLPEIVVSVRDSNGKTRILVEKILGFIGNKLLSLNLLDQFITMVFAGLAAHSTVMKADAIATIGILVDMYNNKLSQVDQITSLIMMLLKEKNNEIYKAIIQYVKVLVKNKMQIRGLIEQLLTVDIQSRDKNSTQLKRLLGKLVKVYGQKETEDMIPEEHQKLLKNALKIEKQQKKKKHVNDDEKKQKMKMKEQDNLDSDLDLDSDREVKPKQKQTKKNQDMEMEGDSNQNVLLKYDHHKEQFHFEESKKTQKKQEIQPQKTTTPLVEFKNGKIIVNEQKEILGQKRRREHDDQGEENPKKIKNDKKQHPKDTVHIIKESGQSYLPKRHGGTGDVPVRGRPEPFAFIQLNPKALNKRHKIKAARAFEEVFHKKSGVLKGIKTHK